MTELEIRLFKLERRYQKYQVEFYCEKEGTNVHAYLWNKLVGLALRIEVLKSQV